MSSQLQRGDIVKHSKPKEGEHGFRFLVLAARILTGKEPMINALLSKYRAKDEIVLEQELCEETGKMVWRWTVPSLGLGGYCRSKRDARSDAKICIKEHNERS